MFFYPRALQPKLYDALLDTPVVLLLGPRQSGKTTLVRKIAAQEGLHYLTLDDPSVLVAAREDPIGLIRSQDRCVVDEIQRAPELLLAIKQSVDLDRRPGRFLLTGSANVLMLPMVADSLAGRMETLSLLPLAQFELVKNQADLPLINWIDALYEGKILKSNRLVLGIELVQRVLLGGYPEVLARSSQTRRDAWLENYYTSLIVRDVSDVAKVEKLNKFPQFLRALAYTAGQLCQYMRLGGEIGIDGKTASRYITILEQMFICRRVPTFASSGLKRIIKTPKLQFIDSALLAHLLSINLDKVQIDRKTFGVLLETFVFSELLKHIATAQHHYDIMYYRDADKVEVDIIIENRAGELIGIEIKGAASIGKDDLKGLKKFKSQVGDLCKMGLLLYDGAEILPLGEGLWAVPISSLWGSLD
ncbi:MAG: ATP-binding protein [Desulfovibrionaceae bacterium]|nr:ATP-binding protein [Desulfovibrionaceae bacterium]